MLLSKIDNPQTGLPQPVFDALLQIVPYVACELLVVNDKNEVLMTPRDDVCGKGWHFPGGLLRYRESNKDRLEKVAENELGIKLSSQKFVFQTNFNKCTRGHIVSLIFLCKTNDTPKNGQFFKDMPENTIGAHKIIWGQIKEKKVLK